MKRNIFKKKLIIQKPKFNTGFFSALRLKHQGKRDGKKEIPRIASGVDMIPPNVKKEHDRIYSYMAYIIVKIDNYNAQYYKELQSFIAEFTSKVNDIKSIYKFLKNKPSDLSLYIPKITTDPEFELFLSSKRESEKDLDEMALRQRRFEEHYQTIEKYKIKYTKLCKEIEELYISIMECYGVIEKNINLVKPMFWKASAEIDIRLSWYWQGVLLKHCDADKLSQTAPEPDNTKYKNYYDNLISEIQTQIKDVSTEFNAITRDKYI